MWVLYMRACERVCVCALFKNSIKIAQHLLPDLFFLRPQIVTITCNDNCLYLFTETDIVQRRANTKKKLIKKNQLTI